MAKASETTFVDRLRFEQHRVTMVLTERRRLEKSHARHLDRLSDALVRAVALYEADAHPDEGL